jgi:membrane protein
MKVKIRGLGTIFKNTFKGWWSDDPFRQSAVIAYYAIFSLPALLVLIINVAGLFFGRDEVAEEISRQIEGAMGTETAEQVGEIIEKAGNTKTGVIAGIIAVFTIIFGATGVFVQLQTNLNNIWDVRQKPNKGLANTLKSRLFSFGLVLSIGFLLLMSLMVSTALAALSHWMEDVFSEGVAYLFYALEFIVSLTVISTLFALMFKVLPDVKMRWKDAFVGGVLTGALFILGKYGLSLYFGKAEPASVYGAAGSIVLVLLWTSYSSMIVFFGAEFTKQYMVYHDIEIQPTANAEKVDIDPVTGNATSKKKEEHEKENRLLPVRIQTGSLANYSKHQNVTMKDRDKKIRLAASEPKTLGSMKEVNAEIARLELKLAQDKRDIKDDLRFAHFLMGLIPGVFNAKQKAEKVTDIGKYIKKVAKEHITQSKEKEDKGWMDKILETLHLKKNGD